MLGRGDWRYRAALKGTNCCVVLGERPAATGQFLRSLAPLFIDRNNFPKTPTQDLAG
jgi:hypothetical protein